MKPISSRHTPAHVALQKFMHGVNIANYLEVPPSQHWAIPHSVVDLKEIRAQGFDHIRVPVGWQYYAGPAPDFKLSDDIFARADNIVTNATALGLNVLINMHDFFALNTNPAACTPEFLAIWRQVATHYANSAAVAISGPLNQPRGAGALRLRRLGHRQQQGCIAFELLNEPRQAATTVVLNPIYAEAIREIRQVAPRATIFVGPGRFNSPDELPNLRLPDDNDNIIVTLHCYDPLFFTHQGADWVASDYTKVTGIQFPGPPKTPFVLDPKLDLSREALHRINQYNTQPTENNPSGPRAFLSKIQRAKAWSDKFGRPIHFGEFGAYTTADQESRAHYYAAMRQAMEAAGFGWASWDWKSGFNYWDTKKQQPLPGMREAFFSNAAQRSAP
ncbi:MAG: glycoside hydrolase family 5 protein [Verrucomicrobiota bacterium]